MACWIFSYMYSRGMPFSFSMSSTAAKNSAFIFKAPLLSYRHAQPHLGDLRFLVSLFRAVYLYGDGAVRIAAERARVRLRALHGLIVPDLDLRAQELFKVPRRA